MGGSYVVTGAGRGIGRAIAQRLAADGPVVALDVDADALAWTRDAPGVSAVCGDAADAGVAEEAAAAAERSAPLAGWVSNAAVFRDAALHEAGPVGVLELVVRNLGLAVTGCAVAVRRFLEGGRARSSTSPTRRGGPSRARCRTRPRRRPSRD